MNIAWVKLPSVLWGAEVIYNKILFSAPLEDLEKDIECILSQIKNLTDETTGVEFAKDLKTAEEINALNEKNKEEITLLNKRSTRILQTLPILVLSAFSIAIIRDAITLLINLGFDKNIQFNIPEEIISAIIEPITFLYCGYYLYRFFKTRSLISLPLRKAKELRKSLDEVEKRRPPQN